MASRCIVGLVVGALGFMGLAVPAGAQAAATQWPGGKGWQPDAPRYGMNVDSNVELTMDDGAVLIANVGYPSDPATGKRASREFPVLLTQSPYTAEQQPQDFYVTRGYINAVVQVRGTGDTRAADGGQLRSDFFGPRQAKDGKALVKWAARLPGSDGKVGLDGCSFLGIDQIFTAAAVGRHSPVKEILPACASNGYDTNFAGGVASQIVPLFGGTSSALLTGARNAEVNDAANKAFADEMLAGGARSYNNAYWKVRTTYEVVPEIVANRIPALLWSGWFPTDGPGSLREYAIFQNAATGRPPFGPMSPKQKVTGRYQLVLGPWDHGRGLDQTIQLEWYDTWLKGADTGMTETRTPLHLYDQGAQQWVNARTWPITDAYAAYYLGTDGSLATKPPAEAGGVQVKWGEPDASGTTTTFDSAPLAKDQVVAGPIAATVYATSSTKNLDLVATVSDVGPDGQATQVATGNLIGSMRALDAARTWRDRSGLMVRPDHPFTKDDFAPVGSTQRYDIELTPNVSAVPSGHHLRLVLSTQPPQSKCASLLSALTMPLPCNPTTVQAENLADGVYTVEWSKAKPSSINIPLVDPSTLPVATSGVTPTSKTLEEPLDWSGGAS